MPSAMIFFALSEQEQDDDEKCADILNERSEEVFKNIQGLRMVTQNAFSATLSVTGDLESIAALEQFISNRDWGHVEWNVFERPAFKTTLL